MTDTLTRKQYLDQRAQAALAELNTLSNFAANIGRISLMGRADLPEHIELYEEAICNLENTVVKFRQAIP